MNAHAQTRFLTARKLLLSYFEASKMLVEAHSGDKGGTIVSAPCQPDLCLVTNQTLDFSIVIPPNPPPSRQSPNTAHDRPEIQEMPLIFSACSPIPNIRDYNPEP